MSTLNPINGTDEHSQPPVIPQSPEKAQAMKAAAEAAGKVLMVRRNNRVADASQYARRFIESGKRGEVYAGRRGVPGEGGWFATRSKSAICESARTGAEVRL
jgi:predicted dehydrogenase